MLYVFVGNHLAGTTEAERAAALTRREQWQWPEGSQPVAEFWSSASASLVCSLFEANDTAVVFQFAADWNDVFDGVVVPVATPEQGRKIGFAIAARGGG